MTSLREALAEPPFGHRIKGDPDEGEWRCTNNDETEFETAEEHIGRVVLAAVASQPESQKVASLEDIAVCLRRHVELGGAITGAAVRSCMEQSAEDLRKKQVHD